MLKAKIKYLNKEGIKIFVDWIIEGRNIKIKNKKRGQDFFLLVKGKEFISSMAGGRAAGGVI